MDSASSSAAGTPTASPNGRSPNRPPENGEDDLLWAGAQSRSDAEFPRPPRHELGLGRHTNRRPSKRDRSSRRTIRKAPIAALARECLALPVLKLKPPARVRSYPVREPSTGARPRSKPHRSTSERTFVSVRTDLSTRRAPGSKSAAARHTDPAADAIRRLVTRKLAHAASEHHTAEAGDHYEDGRMSPPRRETCSARGCGDHMPPSVPAKNSSLPTPYGKRTYLDLLLCCSAIVYACASAFGKSGNLERSNPRTGRNGIETPPDAE
jgi:hypothetical protein